jgi:hypothetical protein
MKLYEDARLPKRFWDKVRIDPGSGCWLWTACERGKGYGSFWFGGKMNQAHRVAREVLVGEIPRGLQTDHLCRVRRCVNPEHLEPVTSRENTLRGDTAPAANVAKTHCPQGHPYDEGNTYVARGGDRKCRRCDRDRRRAYRQRARQEGESS